MVVLDPGWIGCVDPGGGGGCRRGRAGQEEAPTSGLPRLLEEELVIRRRVRGTPIRTHSTAHDTQSASVAPSPPRAPGGCTADDDVHPDLGLVQLGLDASGRNDAGRGSRDGLFLPRVPKVEESNGRRVRPVERSFQLFPRIIIMSGLPFLLGRLEGVEEELAVVFGADEPGVAVLLEEEVVDVLRGLVEGEPGRASHLLLDPVHRPPVDVDLARGSGGEEFPDEEGGRWMD